MEAWRKGLTQGEHPGGCFGSWLTLICWFESSRFHHERRQRGDMTCLKRLLS